MRRFLIWSVLAALVGLVLAGTGYWAYWNFYSRFQPVTITRNQAQIQQLLDEASWVSGGGGGEPLYVIGYRDSGLASANRARAASARDRPAFLFLRDEVSGMNLALWDCETIERPQKSQCLPSDGAALRRLMVDS